MRLLGLAAFPAEQVLAMSLSRTGLDLDQLWERKRQVIEQAPGLSVWRGGETFTFEQVMRQIKAKYVVRLTATPTRKDGHHPIIYMQCGPVRFSMSARTMTESTPFEHQVIPRRTDFRLPSDPAQVAIQEIYAALVADTARNRDDCPGRDRLCLPQIPSGQEAVVAYLLQIRCSGFSSQQSRSTKSPRCDLANKVVLSCREARIGTPAPGLELR